MLLDAAGGVAFTRGAQALGGCPVRPCKPGDMPDMSAWTGTEAVFQAAGYRQLSVPEGARPHYVCRRGDRR